MDTAVCNDERDGGNGGASPPDPGDEEDEDDDDTLPSNDGGSADTSMVGRWCKLLPVIITRKSTAATICRCTDTPMPMPSYLMTVFFWPAHRKHTLWVIGTHF